MDIFKSTCEEMWGQVMSEKTVENDIGDALEAIGLEVFKINPGGVSKFRKQKKFSTVGFSDLLVIETFLTFELSIFMEIKKPSELNSLSDGQKKFKQRIEKKNGYYCVATDVKEALEHVKNARKLFRLKLLAYADIRKEGLDESELYENLGVL